LIEIILKKEDKFRKVKAAINYLEKLNLNMCVIYFEMS